MLKESAKIRKWIKETFQEGMVIRASIDEENLASDDYEKYQRIKGEIGIITKMHELCLNVYYPCIGEELVIFPVDDLIEIVRHKNGR